jgi:hypothetical protein
VSTVIARDQLQHITIIMQGEVIKSLQMALHYENAVLNLTMLHEASITNRQATFATLDQLKQRLLPRMPIGRQLQPVPEPSSHRLSPTSFAISGMSTFDPTSFIPDNYIPPAVTLAKQQDMRSSNHGLTKYFRDMKRNSSLQKSPVQAQSRRSKTSDDINFSQAFQHLLDARGTEDRATIMREIDEIMDSYQGLQISTRPSDPWGNTSSAYGYNRREEGHHMLNAEDPYSQDPLTPTRETLQMPKNMPPTPEEQGPTSYAQSPAPKSSIFEQQTEQHNHHQQYAAKSPYPPSQTQGFEPRWSTTSGSSSNYSDPQSLERNSSTSSQESHTQHSPLPLNHSPGNMPTSISRKSYSPEAPHPYHDYQNLVQPASSHSYVPTTNQYTQPIAPSSPRSLNEQPTAPIYMTPQKNAPANVVSSPHEDFNSLMYSPYATPYQQPPPQSNATLAHNQHQPYPMKDQDTKTSTQNRPKYHLMPAIARNVPSTHSGNSSPTSERTITKSILPASKLGTAPAIAGLRHASVALSIASTDSSSSIPIGILPGSHMKSLRTDTIQSGPAGQERMMNGRPCKDNNYWGFCKGAWSIREDPKKGLNLRTQPHGMYATREIWECSECTFKGSIFSAPHPTKRNKEITIVDPRIHTSGSQIRYRWIFLAKSHVKKKSIDSHIEESNYGCVFCSLQDTVSSVYGGVETLMNHIATSHVADMSENTRRKAKCVIGRMPGVTETDWDINIPVFERVVELS